MIAVDSSVAIAAFGDWHALNERAVRVLDDGAAIPAHARLETYSVLTGFPPPHRAPAELVVTWLADRFSKVLAPPSAHEQKEMLALLAGAGRLGGAVYDALVALTAKRAGATLVTADRRAASIYELVGVSFRRLE